MPGTWLKENLPDCAKTCLRVPRTVLLTLLPAHLSPRFFQTSHPPPERPLGLNPQLVPSCPGGRRPAAHAVCPALCGQWFLVVSSAPVTLLTPQWRPRSAGCGSTLGCLSLGSHRPTPSRLPGLPRSEQSLRPQATSASGGRARRRAAQGAAAALTAPCGRSHPQREDGRWHLGRARRCAPTGLPCGFLLDGSPTPAALTGRRQQAELPLRRQEPLWLLEGLLRGRVWPGSQAPGPSNESTS